MSEETTKENSTSDASRKSPQTAPYPARDSDNGEEQRNRLGYMATEPTEEQADEGDDTSEDDKGETEKSG